MVVTDVGQRWKIWEALPGGGTFEAFVPQNLRPADLDVIFAELLRQAKILCTEEAGRKALEPGVPATPGPLAPEEPSPGWLVEVTFVNGQGRVLWVVDRVSGDPELDQVVQRAARELGVPHTKPDDAAAAIERFKLRPAP